MKPEIKYGQHTISSVEGGMRITHEDGSSLIFHFENDEDFLCLLKSLQRFNMMREDLNIKSPVRLVDLHWVQNQDVRNNLKVIS